MNVRILRTLFIADNTKLSQALTKANTVSTIPNKVKTRVGRKRSGVQRELLELLTCQGVVQP